jgi:prevent-host-death family protein
MRYTASDTDPKLTTLLDAAQREPVFIERDQQEVAVLVSARDYDRLSGNRLTGHPRLPRILRQDGCRGRCQRPDRGKLEELLN